MRLSPVLVAVVATSVSVGLSDSANAQSSSWTFGETYFSSVPQGESSANSVFQPLSPETDRVVFPGLPTAKVGVKFADVRGEPLLSKSTKLTEKGSGDLALEKFPSLDQISLQSSSVKPQPQKWTGVSRIQAEWELSQSPQAQTASQDTIVLNKPETASLPKQWDITQHHQSSASVKLEFNKAKAATFQSFETTATTALSIAKADLEKSSVTHLTIEAVGEYNFDKIKPEILGTTALSIAKVDLEKSTIEPFAEYNFNKVKPEILGTTALSIAKVDLEKSTIEPFAEYNFNKVKPEILGTTALSIAKVDLEKSTIEPFGEYNFNKVKPEILGTTALSIAKADLEKLSFDATIEPFAEYNFDKIKPEILGTTALSIAKVDLEKSTIEPFGEYNFNKVKPEILGTMALSIAKVDLEKSSFDPVTESLSDFRFNKFKSEIILPFEVALNKAADDKTNSVVGSIQNTSTLVQASPSQAPEPQVLVAEIVIEGVEDPELEALIYNAIATEPGRTTTRTQLQQDINSIFALGFFRNVEATPSDTPLGVRVTFNVELNPPLTAVVVEGDQVLPPEVVEDSFTGQYNEIINLNEIEQAVEEINGWYQENGYVLAQIIEAPAVTPDGTITLRVAEGVIEDIRLRFLSSDGEEVDEDGNPIEGNTRDFIITREIQLEPGDVFNQQTAQQDLRRVFGLGIFEDVRLELEPAENDPAKAVMVLNIVERSTGSISLGGGVSSATGLFGTVSYQETNLGGNNQQLAAEVQLGERILLLDVSFTDPWIAGDPYRTSYTVNAFRRREVPNIFEEGENDVRLPNGDRVRIIRTGGGISFTRPFAETPFVDPDWIGSLGFRYQRVQATDADIDVTPRDDADKLLTASESGEDDLITFQFGIARDRRNNPQFPTSGYLFRVGTEQSVPVGSGGIFYNRLRANYTFYVPIRIFNFKPDSPQALAFNIQAGTVLGEFPPYEAFSLGGANTVRGWEEGALAAGRSFVLGSVEYRFPIFGAGSFLIGGALFVDAATTLGTQSTVQGNPGGIRGKPGSGVGIGGGLRIQSPIGPIRIDYGINNEGDGQVHFGIGERF
ncbi:MAG: BamA/TamA family outer membrane protein [Microcoleaceae cyanobacterium]